jgi:cobalt-zinc-cadmium efflux system membrane fusion protein
VAVWVVVASGCQKEAGASAAAVDAVTAGPLCVEMATVVESIERPMIEVPANVLPMQKLIVFSKVPGTIIEITKDRGDEVKKGEVLVRIDPKPYEDAVRQVEAQLNVAQVAASGAASTLNTVTPQVERLELLTQQGVIAQAQLDDVRTDYEQAGMGARSARAQAEMARVGLEIARSHLADTVITAPFDGVVAERLADVGTLAQPMPPTPVLVILDIAKVKVEGAVSELQFGRVDQEAEVEVELDAYPGQPVRARIAAVMPALDPETRTVPISVTLDNDGRFRPAMSATLRLRLLPETWTVVPREALLGDPASGAATVFVVQPDGKAVEQRVEILDRSENRLNVRGVAAGARVAMTGLQRLRGGMTVCVAGERPAAPSAASAPLPQPAVTAPPAGVPDVAAPPVAVEPVPTAADAGDAAEPEGAAR